MGGTLKKMLVFAVLLFAVAFTVIVVNQTLQLAEFAERVHPTAGVVVFWGLIATYAGCLAVPAWLYLRLPAPLTPPPSEESPDFERHLERLRRRLAANPRVAEVDLGTRAGIDEAIACLDRDADELMSRAASRVFLATAVSQNGSLDTLVVLATQLKLVWDVAHVYHQRPTFRDMAYLYTNVVGTAFVAGRIEDADLGERIQPVLSAVLGSAAGAVPGLQAATTVFVTSVVTGSANAFLTLRVGAIARSYSGAIVRRERSVVGRSATARAAAMLGSIAISGGARISAAIARASGRTVGGVLSGVGSRVKDAGSSLVNFALGKGDPADGKK